MNRLSKITARSVFGLGVGALLVLFSGDQPAARQRLQPGGGEAVLIASEPLSDSTSAMCLWPTDRQVDELRARRATAQRLEQQGRRGRSTAGPGGEMIGGDPLRMVRDPNAAFAAVAVDVARNEVIATDENLFQILAFRRTDNTPETARTTPIRTIAGDNTQIEFQSGVYIDPESGDIYATNNDTRNKMAVFAHGGNGDVAPVRLLETPHGAFGITVDNAHSEMLLTIQHDSAIVTYRKQADGKESPIRLLQGPKTGIADPHGIVMDLRDDVFFVANYGSTHDASATIEKRTGVPSGGQDVGKTNWPLGREYAIPGSGTINAPSIVVHKRTDSGNAPAVRVIQGPATQLDWPTGLAFDAERRELFVANDAGSSVLVFDASASGNAAPKRVLKGPKTNLANPTSVFADGKNGELWVANFGGHTITVYPLAANGDTAPIRTLRSAPPDAPSLMIGNPGAVAFDSTRDELLVPN